MISIGWAIFIAWGSMVFGFVTSALLTNSKIWDESPRGRS